MSDEVPYKDCWIEPRVRKNPDGPGFLAEIWIRWEEGFQARFRQFFPNPPDKVFDSEEDARKCALAIGKSEIDRLFP